MKKLILSIFMAGALTAAATMPEKATAQVSFGLSIGGGGGGWLRSGFNANFCYLPAINCYYDVANALYYYLDNGSWMSGPYLPDWYSGYNLANLYQVPMYGASPWMYNNRDYSRYRRYASVGLPRGYRPMYAGPRGGGRGGYGPGNGGYRGGFGGGYRNNGMRAGGPQRYSSGRAPMANRGGFAGSRPGGGAGGGRGFSGGGGNNNNRGGGAAGNRGGGGNNGGGGQRGGFGGGRR